MAVGRILFVDDDADLLQTLVRNLKGNGLTHQCDAETNGERALTRLGSEAYDALVLDLSLDVEAGVESGYSVLARCRKIAPMTRIIVLTGHDSVAHGVRALNLGAASFLSKPANLEHLAALLEDAIRQSQLRREFEELNTDSKRSIGQRLIGDSPAMRSAIEEVEYAAATPQPVLLLGETGCGKSMCARMIHDLSTRGASPFVRYQPRFGNADLINSELFGHRRGAFTGAEQDREGLLSRSDEGTLFLDEIDEFPSETQVMLLGVLQDGRYRPLGSDEEHAVSFKLITASNQNVKELVDQGKLRKDLFHRISHVQVKLPALRERLEDLPMLIDHFLNELRSRDEIGVHGWRSEVVNLLGSYDWPGNVRELQSVVESGAYRAQFDGRTEIAAADIRLDAGESTSQDGEPLHDQVRAFKIKAVKAALDRNGGSQLKAAAELGIDRSTLRRILVSL